MRSRPGPRLPVQLWALAGLYCVASIAHFAHNAEYISLYPNMPGWLTREHVYLAWLAITGVGFIGAVLAAVGWRIRAALSFALYGAFGVDALGHYTLAPCSEHTLVMNATIWFETLAGIMLAASATWCACRQARSRLCSGSFTHH